MCACQMCTDCKTGGNKKMTKRKPQKQKPSSRKGYVEHLQNVRSVAGPQGLVTDYRRRPKSNSWLTEDDLDELDELEFIWR
jgi:hypothetical protein